MTGGKLAVKDTLCIFQLRMIKENVTFFFKIDAPTACTSDSSCGGTENVHGVAFKKGVCQSDGFCQCLRGNAGPTCTGKCSPIQIWYPSVSHLIYWQRALFLGQN